MSEGRRSSFGANVLVSLAFTGALTALAFANSIVLARFVGTEGRGLYAVLVASLGISAPVLALGLGFASTWGIGQGKRSDEVVTLGHIWSGLLLVLGLLGAGAVLWAFDGVPVSTTWRVALACLVTAPAMVYGEIARGAFLGQDRVVRYNAVQAGTVTVLLVANVFLLRLGTWAVFVALGLSYWVVAVVLLIGHAMHVRKARLPAPETRRELLHYGTRASGTHLVEILVQRLDYLLVTPIVGVSAIGLFSVADQITVTLAWGGLVAGRMMLAESSRDREGVAARKKLGLGLRTLLVAVALAAVGAAATGWWIIPTVFGEEFGPAYVGLLILLPTSLFRGASALVGTWLMGRNIIRPVLWAGAVAIAIIAVGSPLAARHGGWLGVAGVRVFAVGVQLALCARAYRIAAGEPLRWILTRADVEQLVSWVRARIRA